VFANPDTGHNKKRKGKPHRNMEPSNDAPRKQTTSPTLGLTKPYRRLVAIRSTQNLHMLEKTLADTDPQTTDVIVMTAKVSAPGEAPSEEALHLDAYDQELMTAVVQRAGKAGKEAKPLIVPTNNPLYAVLRTAKELKVHELVMGASNKHTADEQLEGIAFYWMTLHDGSPAPLTVRVIGKDRDVQIDLG